MCALFLCACFVSVWVWVLVSHVLVGARARTALPRTSLLPGTHPPFPRPPSPGPPKNFARVSLSHSQCLSCFLSLGSVVELCPWFKAMAHPNCAFVLPGVHAVRAPTALGLPHLSVFGVGSARWPDGPPQSGVAQGFNLIPVSGVGEAVGGVSETASDEKIRGNGSKEHSTKT